jgi:hypothetical protein
MCPQVASAAGRPGRVRPYAFVIFPEHVDGMVPLPSPPLTFLVSSAKMSFSALISRLLLIPDHAPSGLSVVHRPQKAVL